MLLRLQPMVKIAVALLICMLAESAMALPAPRRAHAVKDPHYGEVLFYFYQERYFSSLSHLLAARTLHRFKHHDAESELLLGGLYLSYGVHDEAGRIFERLIESGATVDVRDRAWFYLAKIRFQRGYLKEAESALTRVGGNLPADLASEHRSLLALTLMKRGKYEDAIDVLKLDTDRPGPDAAYARYNLGIALVKNGRLQDGKLMLNSVGTMPATDSEMRALKDKANVALGYAEIGTGKAEQARAYLSRVRLNGPLSNKALLGLGWSLTAQNRHNEALAPWRVLQKRHAIDPAVQESLLAVPYALAQLESQKDAIAQYEEAIRIYEKEVVRLDKAIDSIQRGKLLEELLYQPRASEQGWFWQMQDLPDVAENRYLQHLLAGNEFNEALKNYRDLQYLDANLAHWQESVGSFGLMLANRRARFYKSLPAIKRQYKRINLASVSQQHVAMREQLDAISRNDDAIALATVKEQKLLARINRLQRAVQARSTSADTDALRERVKRLKGLMLWQVMTDYQPRLWNLTRETNELGRALDRAKAGRRTLEQEESEAPIKFKQLASRITTKRPAIKELRRQTLGLMKEQQHYLNELAVAELRRQQQRLQTYVVQARFGILQTYDKAVRTRESAK